MTRVFRYHEPAEDSGQLDPIILRKRKRRDSRFTHLIAADESTITDVNGTRPIENFQVMPEQRYVTLTRRESDNIALANPGVRPPSTLEDDHPWLPRRSYVPNSAIGFNALSQIHERYGELLTTATDFCDEKWNTICNSMRRKRSLDARFYSAWHLPIQDVFVLEERSADRSVVALDINAMYSACMQHRIPKPSALRLEKFERYHQPGEQLPAGLYRCRLDKPKSNFIRAHNPFRTFFCGRRLLASLVKPIEVDLNEFEIGYFAHHFGQIYLIDAAIADELVSHPLAREARRAFARRLSYRNHDNKPLADREKYFATLLASCASRPKRRRCTFTSRLEAMTFLEQTCGIVPAADEPESETEAWLGRNSGVTMSVLSDRLTVDAPDANDQYSCFMLNQRVVAKGRVELLELMEHVLSIGDGIRICYVNIDSVHFSVSNDQLDLVVGRLSALASDAMGSFKVEVVTSHGLWLEPGRYWLYSNKVEKFKNRSIGDGTHPFKERSFHVTSRRVGDLHIPIRTSIRMDKSMSDVRRLDPEPEIGVGFVRQRLIARNEATTYSETLDALEENRRFSTPQRLAAFKQLKKELG